MEQAYRRERLKAVPIQPSRDEADTGFEPRDDEPTPEEAAVLADLVEWLMRALETVQQREALTLLLQGYVRAEISREVKISLAPSTARSMRCEFVFTSG